MTTESCSKLLEDSSTFSSSSATRQRRKRKWDQPAESLISATGLSAVPGAVPSSLAGGLVGTSLGFGDPPAPIAASCTAVTAAAALVQKLNQPKTPLEMIAREIVINDADANVRYRLTKRQTQEEIQKTTGAVVITRGKYRPPNALPDNEKPLYLHISSGAHLKDTAERIKAVDYAASIVEGILKQGQNSLSGPATSVSSTGGSIAHPFSTCVFLGFDPDASLNIVECIRGPNDQYISHIMNVTGATVALRGQGVKNSENSTDEVQLPLHLFLSSNNLRSLKEAQVLAENLLDTICAECGVSRTSSCKTYNSLSLQPTLAAVPENEHKTSAISATGSTCLTVSSPSEMSSAAASVTSASSNIYASMAIKPGDLVVQSQPNSYSYSSFNGGTYYSGYGGIYPQATPLQQVAQALRHAPAASSVMHAHTPAANASQEMDLSRKSNLKSSTESEKRPQRRKFQELTVASSLSSSTHQNLHQEPEFPVTSVSSSDSGTEHVLLMPPPKQLKQPVGNEMCLTPPRNTSIPPSRDMPPPPPKFAASQPSAGSKSHNSSPREQRNNTLTDPLIQLMEYGDEEDDDEANEGLSVGKSDSTGAAAKPFWAI